MGQPGFRSYSDQSRTSKLHLLFFPFWGYTYLTKSISLAWRNNGMTKYPTTLWWWHTFCSKKERTVLNILEHQLGLGQWCGENNLLQSVWRRMWLLRISSIWFVHHPDGWRLAWADTSQISTGCLQLPSTSEMMHQKLPWLTPRVCPHQPLPPPLHRDHTY